MMSKILLLSGSAAMVLAVVLGAFGAHALKGRLDPGMLETFTTGVTYHFYHALGLLVLGLVAQHLPDSTWLRWSGWLMGAGIVLFSGSLYLLAFTGVRWLGAVTPFGGTAFILAWLLLFGAVWKGL